MFQEKDLKERLKAERSVPDDPFFGSFSDVSNNLKNKQLPILGKWIHVLSSMEMFADKERLRATLWTLLGSGAMLILLCAAFLIFDDELFT